MELKFIYLFILDIQFVAKYLQLKNLIGDLINTNRNIFFHLEVYEYFSYVEER